MNRRQFLQSVGIANGVAALSGCVGALGDRPDAEPYENPVYEPILADPSVVRTDDAVYVYGTEDDSKAWDCDGTEVAPILRSENLVDWEYVGNAFEEKPDWKDEGNVWAPDVARYDDRYYLYYAYAEWGNPDVGIGVATADSPEGPFEDYGEIDAREIDPQFFLDDGTPYLLSGGFESGIWIVELAEDGLETVGEPTQIAASGAYEAPYLIERDGEYYLFVSTGSCCDGHDSTYEIEVGRSESLFGPYVDRTGTELTEIYTWNAGDPILTGNDRFVGPGHNSVVADDAGDDWLLYHAFDTTEFETECAYFPRRSLMLDRIEWDGGWPTVGDGTPSEEADGPIVDD